MKTPGDYALLHANGMSWKDLIELIRSETMTEPERIILKFALDEAQEIIWARDGFTDEDQAALDSLKARLR